MARKGEHPRNRAEREAHVRAVRAVADDQGGVVSRRQVYALGLTRGEVSAHLRSGRWQRVHSQSLAVHTGPLGDAGLFWAAVFEAGDRACLDGSSSLIAAGLEHFTEKTVRVSVPRGVLVRSAQGIRIRQTRRLKTSDLVSLGIPRTKNHVAAIRAAIWARSDKQAALLLTMCVQQRLTTPELLVTEMLRIKRDRRRTLIAAVITDLLDGVRSLGEHEFAQLCRERGFPEPTRQAVRKGKDGRYYLDVIWEEWGVVVEIDGIQHSWASDVVADALRHNAVALGNALVLRLPLLGLRVAPDDFFEQIEEALVSRGWVCG
jgi:very-short-patch-repair endonuclease